MSFSAMMKAVKEKQQQQHVSPAHDVGVGAVASPAPNIAECQTVVHDAKGKSAVNPSSEPCTVTPQAAPSPPPDSVATLPSSDSTGVAPHEEMPPAPIPLRKALVAPQRVSCVDRLFGKREKRPRDEVTPSAPTQAIPGPKSSGSKPTVSKFAEKLRNKELSFC